MFIRIKFTYSLIPFIWFKIKLVWARYTKRHIFVSILINKKESHYAYAFDEAPFIIRLNFPRRKYGWSKRAFERILEATNNALKDKPFSVFVWGYRDKRMHEVRAEDIFGQCRRIESCFLPNLFPGSKRHIGFIADGDTPYFDGRRSTTLENELNALSLGAISNTPDAKLFIQKFLERGVGKFDKSAGPSAGERLADSDLLIVGQCVRDQAIEETVCIAENNVDFIGAVAKKFPASGKYNRLFYRPHPRNSANKAEIAEIAQLFPWITVLEDNRPFASMLEGRPGIAVMTSGAGMEAAIRGCAIHTFGISYYSNWGFTDDYFECERRTNKLNAEDVFTYVYMEHCIYIDPHENNAITALEAISA